MLEAPRGLHDTPSFIFQCSFVSTTESVGTDVTASEMEKHVCPIGTRMICSLGGICRRERENISWSENGRHTAQGTMFKFAFPL